KSAARRPRRSRQETDIRRMPGIDIRMPDAAEYRVVVHEVLKKLQVWRRLVTATGLAGFGEELIREHAKIIPDAKKPSWNKCFRRGARKCRQHGVQKRKPQYNSSAVQEMPPRKRSVGEDVDGFHDLTCS